MSRWWCPPSCHQRRRSLHAYRTPLLLQAVSDHPSPRSLQYDTSKSLTRRRLSAAHSVSPSQSAIDVKEPSRALTPARFLSNLLRVSPSVAKGFLPPPPPLPSPPATRRRTRVLESQVGPIPKERSQHRQQHAFNCEHDQTVYEPSLEAVLEVLRDIESHEAEELPPIVVDGESKRVSSMRRMVSKSTRWIKKAARRVHQELKRRT